VNEKMSKKILICDDAVTIRKLLSVVIRDAGFDVVEAENGKIALDLAQREAVDLIIVDVNMPVMGGIEFIGEVRKIPRIKRHRFSFSPLKRAKRQRTKGEVQELPHGFCSLLNRMCFWGELRSFSVPFNGIPSYSISAS